MTSDNDYIELSIITAGDSELKDILIAQLSELGFEGFEEERSLLKAFIPEKNFNDQLLPPLIHSKALKYSTAIIEYKNWNAEWEAAFEPVIVDKFCAIRADFHQAIADVEYDIIITPKMSFGTGHHATTYMMIDAMKDISFVGKSVFDFGTGTGVLAILAEKMGASEIEAIDNDEWSIENGKENLVRNQSTRVILYKSDEITSTKKFDVMLANINRNIILQHLESMANHLKPGGVMVLSGLLTGDEEIITMHALSFHLKFSTKKDRNSWICLLFVNGQD